MSPLYLEGPRFTFQVRDQLSELSFCSLLQSLRSNSKIS